MSKRRLVLYVLLLSVVLSLVLSACGAPKNPGVYQEGQQARRVFDRLVADLGDFINGFCGSGPFTVMVGGAAVILARRSDRESRETTRKTRKVS